MNTRGHSHTSGRASAITRASAAFAFTAALVVGVPLLLVAVVGNPFPASLPSVDELRILLTQTGEGFTNLVLGTLAVLIWLIWAQLVVALVVEIAATIRETETRRLPTVPGIQRLAGRLVASMALAATLAAGPVLAPAVGALHFGDFAAVQAPSIEHQPSERTAATESLSVTETGEVIDVRDTVSVQLGDQAELWDLADSAYGDGLSWKLIAQANAGLVDASGAVITDQTETVASGTELRLPGLVDEQALGRFGTIKGDDALGSPATHHVAPGESMWTIAHDEVEERLEREPTTAEVAPYWVDVVRENQQVPSGDVDLIYPGDEVVLPGSDAEPEATEPLVSTIEERDTALEPAGVEPEPSPVVVQSSPMLDGVIDGPADNRNGSHDGDMETLAPTGQRSQNQVPGAVDVSNANEAPDADPLTAGSGLAATTPVTPHQPAEPAGSNGSSSKQVLGLAAFGASVLAAGVTGAIRRRRDLQRRTRPPASIAARPSSEAEAFEAALLQSSSELRESGLGAGWRMMPAAAVYAAREAGPLQFFGEPSGRLHAVAVVDEGDGVRQVEFDVHDQSAEAERRFETAADDGQRHRSDGVPGGPFAPTSLLVGTDTSTGRAVFLDLESSGAVKLVGDQQAVRRFTQTAVLDLAVSDRADDLLVLTIGSASGVNDLERVRSVDSYAEALAEAVRSGYGRSDPSAPVVVVSTIAPAADSESVHSLQYLGASIIAPDVSTSVEVVLDGETATVLPLGTQVELTALVDRDFQSVAELVETTSSSQTLQVGELGLVDIDVVASCPVDAGPVEVKVLGPVEVAGAQSFSSLKAVDVVTYLAFHRNGADADQIKSWVWPAFDPPTDKAFANVMSRARTGLGAGEDGAPFLSRAGADRTYRLLPAVTTDFDRFRAIVEQAADANDDADTVVILKQALELIRGVPFTGGGASSFVWADNHVRAQVEFAIDETVHRCADLALEVGDLETARWAALKGLELVPGCEQCFRRRFLVAGAGQNRSELRRAMADLERSAAVELGEPEAIDLISADLLDLYHQLDQSLVAGSA